MVASTAVVALAVGMSQNVVAETLSEKNYRTNVLGGMDNLSDWVKKSLELGYLVRIETNRSPYNKDGQMKVIYRTTPEYYEHFTYTWTDKDGVSHTNTILERATEPEQIAALLTEIYTNPDIPGYVEDISYDEEAVKEAAKNNKDGFNNYDWYVGDKDLRENPATSDPGYKDGKVLQDGYYMVHTHGPTTGDFDNTQVAMKRSDHNVVKYVDCNYYPFNFKFEAEDQDHRRPFNGATALLVEMKPEYYKHYNEINYFGADDDDDADAQKAMSYIEAVTLMPKQHYVDETANGDNTGFIFNIEGYYSKGFVITKGSTRADKASVYPKKRNKGSDIEKFVSSAPFYNLFEEFSPSNEGPMTNAFLTMDNGKAFYVDHNCSSVAGQNHIIVLGDKDTDEHLEQKYHLNMMFMLPDKRYDAQTAQNPDPEKRGHRYAPYTYYAEKHRPYFYFNKIRANIDASVEYDGNYGDDGVKARVPIRWVSNYKLIVNPQAPESFWIYRVVDGNVQPEPIPLDEIMIREIQLQNPNDEFYHSESDEELIAKGGTYKYEKDGSIIRATSIKNVEGKGTLYYEHMVWILEDYEPGKEVTYIVRGNRKDTGFNLVESNFVTARLPYKKGDGNNMTIALERAKSNYDFETKRNIYANTIYYKHHDFDDESEDSKVQSFVDGNLLLSDLLTRKPASNKIADIEKCVKPGKFIVWRAYPRDPETGEPMHADVPLYEMPFSVNSFIEVNGTLMFRVAEQSTIDKELELAIACNKEGDRVQPYRDLKWMMDQGIKVAFAFRRNLGDMDDDLTHDNVPLEWQAIGYNVKDTKGVEDVNGQIISLIGYFIDDKDDGKEFGATPGGDDFYSEYSYYIEFVPDGVESGAPQAKRSNSATVLVPTREVFAGYMPYSKTDIQKESGATFTSQDDIYHHLLKPNPEGVAVRVSNSTNVKSYNFYHVPDGKNVKDRALVAEVQRFFDGSYQPIAYYPENSSDVNGDENEVLKIEEEVTTKSTAGLHQVMQPATEANHSGKVPVQLYSQVAPGDNFILEIEAVNKTDSPYRNNTYGSVWVVLDKRPEVEIKNVVIKSLGKGKFESTVYFTGKYMPNDLSIKKAVATDSEPENYAKNAQYALWSYVHDNYEDDVMYPEGATFTSQYHQPSSYTGYSADGVLNYDESNDLYSIKYTFTPTGSLSDNMKVATTNVLRMYSPLDQLMSIDNNDQNADRYIVVDTDKLAVHDIPTGVDDLTNELVEDGPCTYYNLLGIPVGVENLVPGVYIEVRNGVSKKIHIQ